MLLPPPPEAEDGNPPEGGASAGGAAGYMERVTQSLSALWALILQRPMLRHECLEVALKVRVFECLLHVFMVFALLACA